VACSPSFGSLASLPKIKSFGCGALRLHLPQACPKITFKTNMLQNSFLGRICILFLFPMALFRSHLDASSSKFCFGHFSVCFVSVATSKSNLLLRTSFTNQQWLHAAPLWFQGPFLDTNLVNNCNHFDYLWLLVHDLFLYLFFNRFWLHFWRKNERSELTRTIPWTTLGESI